MKTKTGKLFLIYFAAAIVIASVIRFFQYVTIIDYRTGFYTIILTDVTVCIQRKYGAEDYGRVKSMRRRLHAAIKRDLEM